MDLPLTTIAKSASYLEGEFNPARMYDDALTATTYNYWRTFFNSLFACAAGDFGYDPENFGDTELTRTTVKLLKSLPREKAQQLFEHPVLKFFVSCMDRYDPELSDAELICGLDKAFKHEIKCNPELFNEFLITELDTYDEVFRLIQIMVLDLLKETIPTGAPTHEVLSWYQTFGASEKAWEVPDATGRRTIAVIGFCAAVSESFVTTDIKTNTFEYSRFNVGSLTGS